MEKSHFFTPTQLNAIIKQSNDKVIVALAEAVLSTYEVHASLERMLIETLPKKESTNE